VWLWIGIRDVAIRQGRFRTSSPALSLLSTHTSLNELVDDLGLEELEIPATEVYDELEQSTEPTIEEDYPGQPMPESPPEVDTEPMPEPPPEPEPEPAAIEESHYQPKRKSKKGKKGKIGYYSSEAPPSPTKDEPDFGF